jgi:hypothetical protein
MRWCGTKELVMRAIARRVQRLETRISPQRDLTSWRIANVLYERRRRLAEAAGKPFEDLPPQRGTGPYLSIAETLRRRREVLAKLPEEPSPPAGRAGTATDNEY